MRFRIRVHRVPSKYVEGSNLAYDIMFRVILVLSAIVGFLGVWILLGE